MTNTIELTNLSELRELGLSETAETDAQIIHIAKTIGYKYYVGTNVGSWLDQFYTVSLDELEILECQALKVILHDNSYNWGGLSNVDIDFKILEDEYEDVYAYVRVHTGSDIRAGYTDGLLLSLGNQADTGTFLEGVYQADDGALPIVEIDGEEFSVYGSILSEEVEVYSRSTDDSYTTYGCIYEDTEEDALKALKELVTEVLKENR